EGLKAAQGDAAAELQLRKGEALQAQGKHADAATEFLKVAVLYPQSEWAPKAQYQAGQAYENAKEKTRAIAVYRALIEQYPQSQAAEQARARLAALDP
ncbi:MAG TPA: tetratricopeptide repeat protein, partial [Armatimonadota bacterium]|nr:tetratricopeptide repeat protein [Armatimonadota bacterium]